MTRVLIDTSVWIDHLHRRVEHLEQLLDADLVVVHPMVVGELALGSIRDRAIVLRLLGDLPSTLCADDRELLALVESRSLSGRGLGYVDAHLLASALITADVRIWTRDRRLADAARDAGVVWTPADG